MLETSSGILEVLQTLEQEDLQLQQHQKTQSHQDISKVKDESKRSVLKSLLKRTHSAPKKINISKAKKVAAADEEQKQRSQDEDDQQPQSPTSPHYSSCCHPFVDKLKGMADKQLHKTSHKNKNKQVKKIPLDGKNKIVLQEETKIMKLKDSPKSERKGFASYVEKRDSDEILEIIDLEESPSEIRKRREDERRQAHEQPSSIVTPDEVIDLPTPSKPKANILTIKKNTIEEDDGVKEPTVDELLEEEFKNDPCPRKTPRRPKEHVYEDIDNPDDLAMTSFTAPATPLAAPLTPPTPSDSRKDKTNDFFNKLFGRADALKQSLSKQDNSAVKELKEKEIAGLTEEEESIEVVTPPTSTLLAPLSSIDSVSLDDEKKARLSAVSEESDQSTEVKRESEVVVKSSEPEIKSVLRRDSSPAQDKKVTFSASTEGCTDDEDYEGESNADREDVKLPDHIKLDSRWSKMRSVFSNYFMTYSTILFYYSK